MHLCNNYLYNKNMSSKITTKEVFERIVTLEAKVDLQTDNDSNTKNYFKKAFFFIIIWSTILEIISTLFSLII